MRSDNQIENSNQPIPDTSRNSASVVEDHQAHELQQWLEKDLARLEVKYSDFVTSNSTLNSFGR